MLIDSKILSIFFGVNFKWAVATCESSVQATIRSLNDNFQSNMRNIQRNNSNDDEIEAPIENVCIDCESGLYSN